MSKNFSGKQELGGKKRRKVEPILNMQIKRAYVSGSWGHSWVEAWVSPYDAYMVNTRTKSYFVSTMNGQHVPQVMLRRRGCCAGA